MVSLLAGCSLARRRFVDQDGRPVEDVLVVSVHSGDMLFGGARVTAFLTDREGCAPIAASHDVVAVKPGYHPWTDDGRADRCRSTAIDDGDPVVLYRRSGRAQPAVHVSRHQVTFVTAADEIQAVPLPSGIGVQLELVDRSRFRVRANGGRVRASRRFFFVGPSSDAWVEPLDQEDDLFFYVRSASGRVHKVGVTRFHSGSITVKPEIDGVERHVPAESLTVLWAELGEQCSVVEPPATPAWIGWLEWERELLAGPDPARVAAALEDAVARGDVERHDSMPVWLTRLRSMPAR